MRRIVAICKTTTLPYRTVPTFSELIDGKVSIKSIREVSIIDLLGRKEIQLNRSLISDYLYGKKVLVTGAGGSIGSELVRQCLTLTLIFYFAIRVSIIYLILREKSKSSHPVSHKTILGILETKLYLKRCFHHFFQTLSFMQLLINMFPCKKIIPGRL